MNFGYIAIRYWLPPNKKSPEIIVVSQFENHNVDCFVTNKDKIRIYFQHGFYITSESSF